MQKLDAGNQYAEIVAKAKTKTSLSNCVLLPALAERFCAEGRLFYQKLPAGVAFLISETGYRNLQVICEPDCALSLPPCNEPLLANLLTNENKNSGALRALRALLTDEGFFVYRDSRKMVMHLPAAAKNVVPSLKRYGTIIVSPPRKWDLPDIFEMWQKTLHHGDYDLMEDAGFNLENIVCIYQEKFLLGAAAFDYRNREATLKHVAVKREERGKGYGGLLVKTCIEKMSERNIRRCALWVERENEGAIKMYLKYGFEFTPVSSVQMIKENENEE